MRRLLAAYEILSDPERRQEYDRAYVRFVKKVDFDYREFLKERADDPESQSKLIFFDLLHLEESEAIALWRTQGGLGFRLDLYLDREDWMDCTFILAEELDRAGFPYEAFVLLLDILKEERRSPYFRHFMPEVDALIKELARAKLPRAVDDETLVECLEELIGQGYPRKEEARWLRTIAEALSRMGDRRGAEAALRSALQRDSSLPHAVQLRRRLNV